MAAVKRSGAVSILLLTALFARGDEDARGRDWLGRIGDGWAESGGACRTFAQYRGSVFAGGIELTVTPVKDSKGPSLEVCVARAKASAVLTLRRDLTRDEKGGTMAELLDLLPFMEAPPASGPARITAAGAEVTFADTGFLRTVRTGDESVRCAVIEARDSRGGVRYFMVSPSGAAIESVSPALGLRIRPVSPDAPGGDLPADPVPRRSRRWPPPSAPPAERTPPQSTPPSISSRSRSAPRATGTNSPPNSGATPSPPTAPPSSNGSGPPNSRPPFRTTASKPASR